MGAPRHAIDLFALGIKEIRMEELSSAIAIEAVFSEMDCASQPLERTRMLYMGLRCLMVKMSEAAMYAYWRGYEDGCERLTKGYRNIEVCDLTEFTL